MEPDKFNDPILQGYYEDLCAADPEDYVCVNDGGTERVLRFHPQTAERSIFGRCLMVSMETTSGSNRLYWPSANSDTLFKKETNNDSTALGYNAGRARAALGEYNMNIANSSRGPLIDCGCRTFTIEEAREHWRPENISEWTQSTPEWGAVRRMQVEDLVRQAREAGWDVPDDPKETEDEYDPELWEFSPDTQNHGRKILSVIPIVENGAHFLTVTYLTGSGIGVNANTYGDPRHCNGAFALRLKKPEPEEVKYRTMFASPTCGVDAFNHRYPADLRHALERVDASNFVSAYKVEKFNGEWAKPVTLTLDELKREAE